MGKVNTGPIIMGIYKITNLINGKFYIGQSIDIYYRFYQHQIGTGHDHKSAIDAAIKKHGKENFSYDILEECERKEIFNRERYWAEEMYDGRCYAPLGYNIDRAGRGGHKINWVSQYDLNGNKINSYFSANYAGKILGVSGVAIRQAMKNKWLCCNFLWNRGLEDKIAPYVAPEYGNPIDGYDKNGNLCLTFKNGVETAEYFGITTAAVSSYVIHKSGYVCCQGYYLTKHNEKPVIREQFKIADKVYTIIYKYDITTRQFIEKFNSYVQAKIAVNANDTKSIRNCCKGIQNIAYGYIWSTIYWDIAPENYRQLNKELYKK